MGELRKGSNVFGPNEKTPIRLMAIHIVNANVSIKSWIIEI